MNSSNTMNFAPDLTQVNRPIRLRLWQNGSMLSDTLLVKHVSGKEKLCGGIEYRLLCVSTDVALPLKDFVALPVELQFVTDRGQLRSVCGIVAQASSGQSDGSDLRQARQRANGNRLGSLGLYSAGSPTNPADRTCIVINRIYKIGK